MRNTKILLITALFTTGLVHLPLAADLLVYDGFSGYSTGELAGQTAAGTGLTGAWAKRSGDGAVTNVTGTGLTFGSLATSGGAASFSIPGKDLSVVGVEMNLASSVTGTVYSSMLFNFSALDGNSVSLSGMRVADDQALNTNVRLSTYANSHETSAYSPGVNYNSATNAIAGQTLAADTTYMSISIFENVGEALSAGNPGTGSVYVLTEAQFEDFVANGRTDANLTGRATGSGANQVTAFASESLTSGGPFNFANGNFMGLASYSHVSGTELAGTYDEFRWGTDLDSVSVVPEPNTLVLMGLSVLALALFRRRR
ncbi:MAG: PEP-CTERM sorting domain-containing protein [Kiritimatiellae bacterium]|jgi:hypothetical protein|nr:PEP-CTERM sorting domain-containing protein [Kiritimatiellia bacterium]